MILVSGFRARSMPFVFCLAFSVPATSYAQLEDTAPADPFDEGDGVDEQPRAETRAETSAEGAALEAVVRGFFLEARVGGGYSVVSGSVPRDDPVFPELGRVGASEALGGGAQIGFHVGYDLTDSVAIQAVTGATFIDGRRTDRVRDVSLFYGGGGIALSFELQRRLELDVHAAAIFVESDTAVEVAETGLGIMGGAGLEYYVHVRHFSIGVDVTAVAPLSPSRIFIGLTPRIKYTF